MSRITTGRNPCFRLTGFRKGRARPGREPGYSRRRYVITTDRMEGRAYGNWVAGLT